LVMAMCRVAHGKNCQGRFFFFAGDMGEQQNESYPRFCSSRRRRSCNWTGRPRSARRLGGSSCAWAGGWMLKRRKRALRLWTPPQSGRYGGKVLTCIVVLFTWIDWTCSCVPNQSSRTSSS
jgi:hypothetical protein